MDVPFHFGMLPHLNASHVLFEEMNRGKARTELVLQSMKDGDVIACYGATTGEDIRRRLHDRQLQDARVVVFKDEDFTNNPHWMAKLENRITRSIPRGRMVYVDHTLVYKIIEIGLKGISHDLGYFVGMIGAENQRSVYLESESRRLTQAFPIERGERG